jgi:DNA-binding protein Fis
MSLRDAAYTATSAYLGAFENDELIKLNIYYVILEEVEKGILEATLQRCSFNQAWTADVLGLSRNTLRKKMQQLGLPLIAHEKRRR